jgi:DNA ligase 1
MQLHEIVEVSTAVASTRSRSRKLQLLGEVLARLGPEERAAGVSFLAGEPRQPRLDLGPAAVHGVEAAPASVPALTLRDVDEALQAIADVEAGTGSRSRRVELLRALLARATRAEQDWLRGLVLRELRQGALEGLLIQALARSADVDEALVHRALMLSGDVRVTAQAALEEGPSALARIALSVGTPLQPMLASTATDLDAAMPDGTEVLVETKIDGARVQVHRDRDGVRVFTRNLRDITARVPDVVEAVAGMPTTSVVLDGEAVALDEGGRPRAFQETMQRVGRDHGVAEARAAQSLQARFFDVLHVDGKDVLDRPLHERLEVLARLVPPEQRPEQIRTREVAEARRLLETVLAAGHEGVMVKDLASPYAAGRRGSAWRKVKPVHTLDLVVLAAEWGSGRRRGWLSNLHLGARADDGNGFVMLGKTFKGLTDETLTWQTEQLLAREERREGHVVHVRPELVVEIALDGVVRSPRYPGGLALRFARVRGYRHDKAAEHADALAAVRAIHEGTRLPTG